MGWLHIVNFWGWLLRVGCHFLSDEGWHGNVWILNQNFDLLFRTALVLCVMYCIICLSGFNTVSFILCLVTIYADDHCNMLPIELILPIEDCSNYKVFIMKLGLTVWLQVNYVIENMPFDAFVACASFVTLIIISVWSHVCFQNFEIAFILLSYFAKILCFSNERISVWNSVNGPQLLRRFWDLADVILLFYLDHSTDPARNFYTTNKWQNCNK